MDSDEQLVMAKRFRHAVCRHLATTHTSLECVSWCECNIRSLSSVNGIYCHLVLVLIFLKVKAPITQPLMIERFLISFELSPSVAFVFDFIAPKHLDADCSSSCTSSFVHLTPLVVFWSWFNPAHVTITEFQLRQRLRHHRFWLLEFGQELLSPQ